MLVGWAAGCRVCVAVDAPLERQRGLRVWRLQAQACMLLSVMMCGDGVASAFAHGMEKLSPPAPLLMCDDHRPSRSACVGRRGCRESVPSQVDSCCVGRALLCFYPTGLLAPMQFWRLPLAVPQGQCHSTYVVRMYERSGGLVCSSVVMCRHSFRAVIDTIRYDTILLS